MSIKVLGIQPGTCTDGMTNEEYFQFSMGNCEVRQYQLELPAQEEKISW